MFKIGHNAIKKLGYALGRRDMKTRKFAVFPCPFLAKPHPCLFILLMS